MSGKEKHDTHDVPEQREVSTFLQRFAQRRLHSSVTDVQKAQRKYDRAAGFAGRSRMVGSLLSRYASSDASGADGERLVFTGARQGGPDGPTHVVSGFFAGPESGPFSGQQDAQVPLATAISRETETPEKMKASAAPDRFPGEQGAGEGGRTGQCAAPAALSGMLQKLAQRSSSPGLIDTDQAQRQYRLAVSAITQRSGLLSRLRSRDEHGDKGIPRSSGSAGGESRSLPIKTVTGNHPDFLHPKGASDAAPAATVSRTTSSTSGVAANQYYVPAQRHGASQQPSGRIQGGERPAELAEAAFETTRNVPAFQASGTASATRTELPAHEAPRLNSDGHGATGAGTAFHRTLLTPPAGPFRLSRKKSSPAVSGRTGTVSFSQLLSETMKTPIERYERGGSKDGAEAAAPESGLSRKEGGGRPASAKERSMPANIQAAENPAGRERDEAGADEQGNAAIAANKGISVSTGLPNDVRRASVVDSGGNGPALILRKADPSVSRRTRELRIGSEERASSNDGRAADPNAVAPAKEEHVSTGAAAPSRTAPLPASEQPARNSVQAPASSSAPLLLMSTAGVQQGSMPQHAIVQGTAASGRETAEEQPNGPHSSSGTGDSLSVAQPSTVERPAQSPGASGASSSTPLLMRTPNGSQQKHPAQQTVARSIPASKSSGAGKPLKRGHPAAEPPGQTREVSSAPSPTPLLLRRRSEARTDRLSQTGEFQKFDVSAGETAYVSSGRAGTDGAAMADTESETPTATGGQAGHLPVSGPAPATQLLLQRMTGTTVGRSSQFPDQLPAIAKETDTAPELRAAGNSALRSAIVWRKGERQAASASALSDHVNSASPAANSSVVHRQAGSGAPESSGFTEQYQQSGPAMEQGTGVDLEQLADQVSRLIRRRLETERERRGVGL